MFEETIPKLGLDVRFVDIADGAAVEAAINDDIICVCRNYFQSKIGGSEYFTVKALTQAKQILWWLMPH